MQEIKQNKINICTKQGNSEGGIQAEPNTKVGRYSVEERKDRIMRYLKKKNQRNFNKTIKVYIHSFLFNLFNYSFYF